VALSGTAGSALNTAVTSANQARKEGDGRLSALQGTKAALSGVQAAQALERDGLATDAANRNNAAAGLAKDDAKAEKGATNTVGISASYGSQSSKSETRSESSRSQGSTLTAGQNMSITATGKKGGAQSGDITVSGSALKAGGDLTLDAVRDINLLSAQNTERTDGKNSSKGGNIGVGIGVGSGGYGISVSAGVNAGKGHENGNGLSHSETTLDAGNRVSLTSGRDTTLKGAQVSGEQITADVGRNLTLQSEQDSDRYDASQKDISAGGSFTFGSMTGSGYVSATQDKLHSNFDSVKEQTGLYAGSGGYDIRVGEHTQLDGAVIASTADRDKNSLDTGTLGWSDIDNRADFSAKHSGGSLSSGGPVGKDLLTNMSGGMLSGANNSGYDEGTTKAAVSDGSLTIRDTAKQQQDIAELNRDTEHANDGSISPIFNKEKEQKRLKEAQLIGELGMQAMDVARTQGEINALKAQTDPAKLGEAREQLLKEGKATTDAAVQKRAYDNAQAEYGTGSNVQKAMQAVTGALTALAGNNLAGALASGASPYLATEIKRLTTDAKTKEVNVAANAMAHAVLGAITAELNNQSALAGGVGAGGGELAARVIAGELFPGKALSELSESEKQQVSGLSQLAAGIAGGLAAGNSLGAVTGAQAGKNAVENNFLSPQQAETLNKSIEEQKAGKNLLGASQNIVRLTNEDRASNVLLQQFQSGQPLTEGQKQELAGLLNQYGYELQSIYGYTPQQAADAIQSLIAGKAFVASTGDTKAYNEALSYLKGYSVQSGQAALGTDALLALPGAPGIIARSTLAAGGGYQTGTGIGQVVDGNYGEGALNIGLGTAAIFGGIAGNNVLGKTDGAIASPGNSNIWQTGSIGNVITKSEGALTGPVTKIEPSMTKENIRSLNRENESAKILSQSGFYVEQNPSVAGNKNPDYRINGEIFDNYAPRSNSVRNIYSEVKTKIDKGQTSNVVINMSDTKVSIPELQKQLTQWPIMGLDKVIIIDKTGNAIRVR